jgi:phage shock protein PspC (stress-responsive transcriptional regulator)
MTPEYAAYKAELRRIAWPLRTGGLALILLGACVLIASKSDMDPTLRMIGFVLLGLGWGLWGYVIYIRSRWAKAHPFTGPRS